MSQRSKRSKARLRALKRDAWFAVPRELTRYGGLVAVLGGIVFVARGWHVIESGRTDVVTFDARGFYPHGGGSVEQASGQSAQVLGSVDFSFGLFLVGVGGAALFVRRR